MFILVSVTRSVTIRGERERNVCCESCRSDFSYVITRTSVGDDSHRFSWTEKAAYEKALKDAEKKLDKALTEEHDSVPCPACGWVQLEMVDYANGKSYEGLKTIGTMAFLVGLVIGTPFVVGAFFCNPISTFALWLGLSIVSVCFGTAAVFSLIRNALLRRCDPNRNYEFPNKNERFRVAFGRGSESGMKTVS